MRTRKVMLVSFIVLVMLAAVVIPAQAEPPQTEFIATTETMVWLDSVVRQTGNANHIVNTWTEIVNSPDPRFRGTLSSAFVCQGPAEHPQMYEWPGWGLLGWGACDGVWRMEVTADSGWEGVAPGLPQADYRNGQMTMATGHGYGEFRNMTVKWYQNNIMEWGVTRYVTIKQDK